ncbi:unnamed protein product, partial [Amoebophrya sp. A120]|eukprot:GSA120T00015937001.1
MRGGARVRVFWRLRAAFGGFLSLTTPRPWRKETKMRGDLAQKVNGLAVCAAPPTVGRPFRALPSAAGLLPAPARTVAQ